MKDFSLIIIRPEIIERRQEVLKFLRAKGYEVLAKKHLSGWRNLARNIYTEFTHQQMSRYLEEFDKNKFSDDYIVVFLKHQAGNTIAKIKEDQGNFKNYQTEEEDTLRCKFGLPSKYNIEIDDVVFTFPGIHCPGNQEELEKHIKLLDF